MNSEPHVRGEWCGPQRGGLPGAGRHLTTVVYTRRLRDGLRRRWWVVCWECDLRLGAFTTAVVADGVQQDIERNGLTRDVAERGLRAEWKSRNVR